MNTPGVNVEENIKRLNMSIEDIKKDISKFEENMKFAKEEILRLEGCLIVFNGFKEAGIKIINNNEENTCEPQNKEQEEEVCVTRFHNHSENKEEDKPNGPLKDLYEKYRTL